MGEIKLAFHNNRFIVIEKKVSGIYLARKIKNELHIDFIKNNAIAFNKYIILPIILDEFDIDLNIEGNLYILYINNSKELVLRIQQEDKELSSKVISNIENRIYHLTLVNQHNSENIFFIQSTASKSIFKINHILLDDDVEEYLVDEVETYEILNPFKILKDDENLLILYYYKNQICLKGFDFKNRQWSPSIILTDNKNRFYLDAIKIGNILHLVYSNFDLENFMIKYESFSFDNDYITKTNERNISAKGNYTDPIILKVGNKIWICWKDTNQLLSVYSIDDGISWSEIYQWKDVKRFDVVKYKYVTDISNEWLYMDNVYGTTGKEIKFVGFGDIKDASLYYHKNE